MTRPLPVVWALLECGHYGHESDLTSLRKEEPHFMRYNCRTCYDLMDCRGGQAIRRAVRNDRND